MKLHIDDQVYDLQETVGGAALGDLLALKKQRDLGVKSITERFKAAGGRTIYDLLEDPEYIEAVIAVVWLSRRKAGENITIDQAAEVPFTSIAFSWTEEEEAEADPKDGQPDADESGSGTPR